MKIFITGATGYIGERLAVRLLQLGYDVNALCRQQSKNPSLRHDRFHFYQGDLNSKETMDAAMKGCDAVFHLAALAKVWVKNSEQYYDINLKGTVNVLDAAWRNGINKVVFTSSAATYGVSKDRPLTEEDLRNYPFFTDYETSKFLAEERVQHYVRKGLNVVIVHPTKVYGPGLETESNAVSQMIKRYLEGKWHIIPGNGKMIGNFSYVEDVVNGHIQALEKGRSGEKYILGGINLSFNDFFALLKQVSGKDFWTVHISYPMMMLYGLKEQLFADWFGKEPKITRPWIKKYNYDLALSSEKAQRELGYNITPLEEGLKKTIAWLSTNPK